MPDRSRGFPTRSSEGARALPGHRWARPVDARQSRGPCTPAAPPPGLPEAGPPCNPAPSIRRSPTRSSCAAHARATPTRSPPSGTGIIVRRSRWLGRRARRPTRTTSCRRPSRACSASCAAAAAPRDRSAPTCSRPSGTPPCRGRGPDTTRPRSTSSRRCRIRRPPRTPCWPPTTTGGSSARSAPCRAAGRRCSGTARSRGWAPVRPRRCSG